MRATAEHDPAVARALSAVIGMLERPPHVLRPAVAVRVARGPRPASRHGDRGSSAACDPHRPITNGTSHAL
jgi:hypothetical protein